jgi:hypothetical protein
LRVDDLLDAFLSRQGISMPKKTRSLASIQPIGGADISIAILALHHLCWTDSGWKGRLFAGSPEGW